MKTISIDESKGPETVRRWQKETSDETSQTTEIGLEFAFVKRKVIEVKVDGKPSKKITIEKVFYEEQPAVEELIGGRT